MIPCCMVLHNMAIRARMNLDILEEDKEQGIGNREMHHILAGNNIFLPHDIGDMIEVEMPDDEQHAMDLQRNRQGQHKRHAVAHNNF